MNNKPELLAPAGSADCLKAAFLAGADAVYLAGKRFGARAFASNFDEEGLRWARKVTKSLGKKMYITLNTIVFEHEWHLLEENLDFLESLQPDALIIQDIGIAVELRKRGSRIPLHLSTQGAWYGQGGAEQLKELGITRVILPRETSKEEIAEIVKNNPFEVEVFVHGAMCYSISGRCFWSAALGSRSGNRGTCAQPCRKEYKNLNTNHCGCIFSPRDLRLIKEIKPLMATGIASLKIEGRMKSPEYVYQVVKAYRAAIDGDSNIDIKALDEVFSRSSSIGFFNGCQRPSEWRTGNNPGREGLVVGITTGKYQDGLTELILKNEILAGDGLFWYENNQQKGARITYAQADKKQKNHIWVRGLPRNLGANVEIRRTSKSNEASWEILWDRSMERYPIDLIWSGYEGTPLRVESCINGHKIELETEEKLCSAMQKGLDEGPLQEKFNVIGEEYKSISQNTDNLGPKLHISGTALKQLKRSLSEELSKYNNLPKASNTNECQLKNKNLIINTESLYKNSNETAGLRVRIWNKDFQLTKEIKAQEIVLPWEGNNSKALNLIPKDKIIYWLPPILNSKQFEQILNQLKKLSSGHFLCFGWEAFKLAKLLPQLSFELDWCFNTANLKALGYIKNSGVEAVLSKEWKDEDLPKNLNAYKASSAWNPLVSFTRFAGAANSNDSITNPHNDKFFVLAVGNGVTAMFLEEKITKLQKSKDSIQIDLAFSPKENPTQVIDNLNRIIDQYNKAKKN